MPVVVRVGSENIELAGPGTEDSEIRPARYLPGRRSIGVHLKMREESFARRFVSVQVNRDGGVIVIPFLDKWRKVRCVSLNYPLPSRPVFDPKSAVRVGGDSRAKLHYHRSGYTSVQPQDPSGKAPRLGVHLAPLDSIHQLPVFTVAARIPSKFPRLERAKRGDLIHATSMLGVRSLFVAGLLYDRSQVAPKSIGGYDSATPLTFTSGDPNVMILDLSGYGLNSVLALFFVASPADLADTSCDATVASYSSAESSGSNGVAIMAGGGYPHTFRIRDIPPLEDFHRHADLDPRTRSFSFEPSLNYDESFYSE